MCSRNRYSIAMLKIKKKEAMNNLRINLIPIFKIKMNQNINKKIRRLSKIYGYRMMRKDGPSLTTILTLNKMMVLSRMK